MFLHDLFEQSFAGNRALLDYFQWKWFNDIMDSGFMGEWDYYVEEFGIEDDDYYSQPQEIVKDFAEWCMQSPEIQMRKRQEPRDVPAWMWMHPRPESLLPASTWLLHFTNHPREISQHGFIHGISDLDRMAFTWDNGKRGKRSGPGYNFAYPVEPDVDLDYRAAYMPDNGYGRHAVLFQSSGIRFYHDGDEEIQVVFYGPEIDRSSLIDLHQTDDGWETDEGTASVSLSDLVQRLIGTI